MRKLILSLVLLTSLVSVAYADWFGIGTAVGEVAKAGASTAINITWAETVRFLAPTLVLLVITIIPLIALIFASTLTWKYIDLVEEAIKDKMTWKDATSILLATCLALPIILGLCYFSYRLGGHALIGLQALGK